MAASGVRGVRYLQEAKVDEVWCNDYNPTTVPLLTANLTRALGRPRQPYNNVGRQPI